MALSRMAGDTSAKAAPLTGASAGIPGSDAVFCVPPGSNRAVKLNQVPLPCMASASLRPEPGGATKNKAERRHGDDIPYSIHAFSHAKYRDCSAQTGNGKVSLTYLLRLLWGGVRRQGGRRVEAAWEHLPGSEKFRI